MRGPALAAVPTSITAGLAAQQQSQQVAAQALNQLSRVTAALQAMQNLQTAAHGLAIAAPSSVPDGLQPGGLEPDSGLAGAGVARPVTTWVGAQTPTQSSAAGTTTVTINQTAAQALLSWNSFNVGRATTVNFNQHGNTDWTALNQISKTASPSQILGSITATGHVYLINPNGIIFGGASQVNVGSLVASTAALSSSQYFANGIYSTEANNLYTPSFTGAGGAITVEPGAQITTNVPVDVTVGGGIVLLLGTEVTNAGSITTADGQTELAAGDNFIIRPGFSTNGGNASLDSTTLGNEIAVSLKTRGSSLHGGSGLVQNIGLITSTTGDITLVGETVIQNGVLYSTTSTATRGTIHLLANNAKETAPDPFSSVTLGSNALTVIEPDLAAGGTELASQRASLIAASQAANDNRGLQLGAFPQFNDLSPLNDLEDESRIEINSGGTVEFQSGSDSLATGGQIAVSATQRVQVDNGALLDVAGSYGVPVPMSQNQIAVNIQNFELRDNPLNRQTQNLRNNTVYVDAQDVSLVPASSADQSARDYTAGGLLEVSGYLANQGQSLGQYTAIGGTIDIQTGAKGAIVVQPGATLNLNGGSLQYSSGFLQQSYLLATDGQVYDVNNAPAYLTYAGIYNGFTVDHAAWGITQTYADGVHDPSEVFEPGYLEGRAAGNLVLSSPTTILDGTIDAATVNGPFQVSADPANVTDPYQYTQTQVAEPGSLIVASQLGDALGGSNTNVSIGAAAAAPAGLQAGIPAALAGATSLDAAMLNAAGLGAMEVVVNGSIHLTAPLQLAAGGQLALYGVGVDIGSDVTVPGGSVTVSDVFAGNQLVPPRGSKNGNILVAPEAAINTAGLWTNLVLDPDITFTQAFINGGAVSLDSLNNLTLGVGSVINSSAGGVLSIDHKVTGGSGGAITLAAAASQSADQVPNPAGVLTLGGALFAYGTANEGASTAGNIASQGGALTLSSASFLIANAAPSNPAKGEVWLDPEFFTQGFSAYNLQSTGQITLAPGTIVNLTEPSYQASTADENLPTGSPASAVFKVAVSPLYVPNSSTSAITQRAGASFSATVERRSLAVSSDAPKFLAATTLSIGSGAAINVDPLQSIALAGTGQVTIDGQLNAPGGAISATSSFNPLAALPRGPGTASIWLGPDAVLNASGAAVHFQNADGSGIGLAPAGGTITLGEASSVASIIIRQGATVQASGSATTDELAAPVFAFGLNSAQPFGKPIPVAGAGGAISLTSDEGIYNDGVLTADAGGPGAAGGSLAMTLEADDIVDAAGLLEATPRIFTITQADPGPQLPANLRPGASAGLHIGTAAISAAAITQGGFGSVTLFSRDSFLFEGNVTLSVPESLTLQEGVYTESNRHDSVTLQAPYVALTGQSGNAFTDQANGQTIEEALIAGYSKQRATGAFTVDAYSLDIDDAVAFGGILPADGSRKPRDLAGFGTVNLNSSGDIQFTPVQSFGANAASATDIVTTADINLTAREIYTIGGTGSQSGSGASGTVAFIVAGYDPTAPTGSNNGSFNPKGVLNVRRTPGTTASAPDALLGTITLEAATINQGGVIWQPLGGINLGDAAGSSQPVKILGDHNTVVNFQPGSITSVSAAGLNIPFGGTADGVNYDVNGFTDSAGSSSIAITSAPDFNGLDRVDGGVGPGSITIQALHTNIATGAEIDLRGGGALSGAGFISGEGGSTDVLTTPLLSIGTSGVTQPGLGADPVYAIVSGPQPVQAVAYTQSGDAGSVPALGAQIIIPAGVPGLPAGRYTLLPAAYALEPGGYRVEFDGAAALNAASVSALPNGSFVVAGFTGRAATGLQSTLATSLTITPGATVLHYADYDQESYSAFLLADAAGIGETRPELPTDAGLLRVEVPASSAVSLIDNGTVLLQAAAGSVGGTLQISGLQDNTAPDLVIYGAAPPTPLRRGTVALSAAELDAFNPFQLALGGVGAGFDANVNSITLENGATLQAPHVVLTALTGGITLMPGSTITTINEGSLPVDSTTEGLLSNGGASVLDVGNGFLVYGSANADIAAYGPIDVQDGASIFTDGSIDFSTSAAVEIGTGAHFGGRTIELAVPEINIGDPALVDSVNAPPGVLLSQAELQTLAQGVPQSDVPAVQTIILTATDSLNFFGTTGLDLGNANVVLEINAPAIYGYGSTSDVATIAAGTIVWNGISLINSQNQAAGSIPPGGTLLNGPGTGAGTLDLDAQTVIFGYSNLDIPARDNQLDRLAAGFATVNVNASTEVTANNQSSLAVYQSVPVYGQAGTGGTLNLNTPLLTAADQGMIGFTAGNAVNVEPDAAVPAATGLPAEAAGGEIDLISQSINIGSSVILPSGKLDLQAGGDIMLGAGALLNLAGATTVNVDQTIHGFGGALVMASAGGNISQAPGSEINVSAIGNNAGSITITATKAGAGQVSLLGTLIGGATGNNASGQFDIRAQNLGDFAALNNSLDEGGFFQSRSFDIQQGDLNIGDGVQAHNVSVSLDNGNLTVTGLINASGNGGGVIALSASGNLTLAGTATLEAQGTMMQLDSYGQAIPSENSPLISLTSGGGSAGSPTGELSLNSGAVIDLASADGMARGDLELNAPRTGPSAPSATDGQTLADPLDGSLITGTHGPANAQGDNVAISAPGPISIIGAATIALNATATYANAPADPNDGNGQIIDQAYLGLINADSQAFINAALANPALASSIKGLTGDAAFFLRPGVENLRPGVDIVSNTSGGDLAVNGDIDLSVYRYGPGATQYGAGEPGVIDIRAGGGLNVYGSISDGFATQTQASDSGTAFASGWVLYAGEPYGQNVTTPIPIEIDKHSGLGTGVPVNYAVPITGGSFAPGAVAPTMLTVAGNQRTTVAFVATSTIRDSQGQVLFAAGSTVPAHSLLPDGATIATGGSFPFSLRVGAVVWPANTPFTVTTSLPNGSQGVKLSGTLIIPAGGLIPGGSSLKFDPQGNPTLNTSGGGDADYVSTRIAVNGTQGQLDGLASLLPAGDLSWSINLVAGADTTAASPDVTQAASALAGSGNLTLADTHYGNETGPGVIVPAFSVIRTGTGSLGLFAGGSIDENSAYGVYTAGAPSAAILTGTGENPYNLPQDDAVGARVLGGGNLQRLIGNYAANYPTDGGNVTVSAQGDLNSFRLTQSFPQDFTFNTAFGLNDTDAIGNWLWRQGGDGQPGAWWIEYGSLSVPPGGFGAPYTVQYTGFQGIGTLGGGNLNVSIGGNALGLNLAVASDGRVANGVLVQDGGGALNVSIGGAVNFLASGLFSNGYGGLITDLRGTGEINVGSVGTIMPSNYGNPIPGDPRFLSPYASEVAAYGNGIELAPGDATLTVNARGDLVISSLDNPGAVENVIDYTPVNVDQGRKVIAGNGYTDYSLWTPATAVDLFSAGGDVVPTVAFEGTDLSDNQSGQSFYPSNLSVISQNGSLYLGDASTEDEVTLLPSVDGQLALLAADSIIGTTSSNGGTSSISVSGAALASISTPFDPAITVYSGSFDSGALYTNRNPVSVDNGAFLIDFGINYPSSVVHADTGPALVYAATGDILDVQFGIFTPSIAGGNAPELVSSGVPFDIFAGRDIVESGSSVSPDIFLNLGVNDITSITAGRDIIGSSFDIAGPGELVVQAGRNVDLSTSSGAGENDGFIQSIGPLFGINASDRDAGAGIAVLAGVGPGPDYSGFANDFLNPASALVLTNTSGDNIAGTLVQQDDALLYAWLQAHSSYDGDAAGAYAYFQTLPGDLQNVFLRQLYFSLLNTSGVDFNAPTNNLGLYKTYILGQQAIAALFPSRNPGGQPIAYNGAITMFGSSGILTDLGGTIETLTPGGATTVGVEGPTPIGTAGILTQGTGDIDMYALDSVELGESRVLTTFGGNVLIWSAQGDINAGRGTKTTIIYAPEQVIYDNYGDIFLSPSVPSSGAGIGTLNPIPSVAPGDVNLVAPLGTVDAGEAGIRVSGNLNIAALHVLNAANIQVQGSSTGVPTAVAPDIGGLTSAGNAAGAAAQAAENAAPRSRAAPLPSIWIVEILGYGGSSASPPPPPDDHSPEDIQRQKKKQATIAEVGAKVQDGIALALKII